MTLCKKVARNEKTLKEFQNMQQDINGGIFLHSCSVNVQLMKLHLQLVIVPGCMQVGCF